jgi:hypothetical protein
LGGDVTCLRRLALAGVAGLSLFHIRANGRRASASQLRWCRLPGSVVYPAPSAAIGGTCRSLAAYKRNANGAIDDTAIVLISQSPSISMTTVSPFVIKANQVCGLIRPRDIDAASFTLGDRPADPAQTATLRQQMQSAMKGFFGHKICTTYVPADGSLLAKVTVDGSGLRFRLLGVERSRWRHGTDGKV